MKYVLGIDSGGTNFRVKAAGLDGSTLGSVTGQPASLHYAEAEEAGKRINRSLDLCLEQFGGKRGDAVFLVCGTTGIDSGEDQKRFREMYEALPGLHCPMELMNDAQLAHYTVTGGEGILLISGTGSIAFGKNRKGESARVGGWPLAILGDEGSGTWVTKKALRHVGRLLDGAVQASPMTDLICRETGIRTRDDLVQIGLRGALDPAKFPQLGRLVNEAAGMGDIWAEGILKGAAKELCGIVADAVHALSMEEDEDIRLGVWGSNLLKSNLMMGTFTELIRKQFPQIRICLPEKEAVDGAVELAIKLALKCCEEA